MDEIRVGDIRLFLGETTPIRRFDAVITVLFFSGKLVLVKNSHRAWEFPGGRREGNETFKGTARRESSDEAGVMIEEIVYLGHYVTPDDKITAITCAEAASLEGGWCEEGISHVGIFESLPPNLSFADGREQLILDYVLAFRLKDDE